MKNIKEQKISIKDLVRSKTQLSWAEFGHRMKEMTIKSKIILWYDTTKEIIRNEKYQRQKLTNINEMREQEKQIETMKEL